VSLGRPAEAPYLPVSLMAERTPRALADGTLYRASLEWEPKTELLYELEDDFEQGAAAADAEAQALSEAGRTEQARALLEDCTARCVEEALQLLSAGR